MPLPLPHVLIGGAVITAVALTYEFVIRKKPADHGHGPHGQAPALADGVTPAGPAPAPDAPTPTPTTPAVTAPVVVAPPPLTAPVAGQAAPGQPWRPRPPKPRRMSPPALQAILSARLPPPRSPGYLTPGVPAVVAGRPVMSGDPVRDLINVIGFHGYRQADIPIIKRAQMTLGVAPDGLVGPHTWSAMAAWAASHHVPMPSVGPFTHWADAPAARGAPLVNQDHNTSV
jgi:hypothetical protein